MFGTSPALLRLAYQELCSENSRRRKFTREEDAKIKEMADKGVSDWSEIAKHIKNKTPKQCRDRYYNYLEPGITNSPWTYEEDMLLFKKAKEFNNRWTEIASFFPGRGPNNIKNRWHKFVSKNAGTFDKALLNIKQYKTPCIATEDIILFDSKADIDFDIFIRDEDIEWGIE